MADKKLLPLADPSTLSISYLQRMRVKGRLVYTTVLLALVAVFALLPIIRVDVSARGSGLLQASVEKNDLVLPVTGRIAYWGIEDNKQVMQGDTLLRIDASGGQQQDRLTGNRIAELQQLLTDAQHLSAAIANDTGLPKTTTRQYRAAWEQYSQQRHNTRIRMEQAEREYRRYQTLFERKVISAAEHEQYQSQYEQVAAEYTYISRQYRTQWEAETNTYRAELNELYRRRADWENQESFYTLLAPISGTIQNLAGLQNGTPVFANQKIAEISPDSSLIAMVYVSPADIGLIQVGQSVRFQVDAFNYNQWGVLKGKVMEIADDIVLDAQQQPVFRVRCETDSMALSLSNGYTGHLKKGMTVQARFMVTRRSLFQLLYDKVDDWLNPNV